MKNKVLVELIVPEVDVNYSVYLPINKKIGNIINLLNQAIEDLTDKNYQGNQFTALYNQLTGICYPNNETLINTDIRNGSVLILI